MNREERIKQEATALCQPVCDACGLPFTEEEWDNRHTGHEPGCPFADTDGDELEESYTELEELLEYALGCDCDLNYHEDCCPDCKFEEWGTDYEA